VSGGIMVISDEVLGGITYWVILEVFYFIVLLPSVLNGGWKNFEWETFIAMSIITPLTMFILYLFGRLLLMIF
jgi:hypothetical protein